MTLPALQRTIVACTRCPELRASCADVAREKKREWRDATYWGKPVPAFGDPEARLVLVGLAPGAHGSNRTGRPFTGDASGVWLYRALWRAGFANQAEAVSRDDGLLLHDAYVTAAVRCAPPGNKPTPEQLRRCAPFLDAEFAALERMRVVLGLGAIGTRASYDALKRDSYEFAAKPVFAHGAEARGRRARDGREIVMLASYHPSRQNTNTGVLTEAMLDGIFARARELLGSKPGRTQKRS